MRRAILGLVDGEPGDLGRHRGTVDLEADRLTSFGNGEALHTGTAAGHVTREETRPVVMDEAITTETVETRDQVATEWIADLESDPAYVALDTSDGTFLWDWLELQWDVDIERARIDCDALTDRIVRLDRASVWQVAHSRRDGDEVGINYHDDAGLQTAAGGHTMLGVAADWNGYLVEGTIAESGYLAEWSDLTDEQFAAWVREEILPHATIPEDEQQELDGGEA